VKFATKAAGALRGAVRPPMGRQATSVTTVRGY
jgi:hypothetical protein